MGQEIDVGFEWDPVNAVKCAQARRDVRSSRDCFPGCIRDFLYDETHSQVEDRWFTLGFDIGGRLLAISHTYEVLGSKRVRIRIISARKATTRDRRTHEKEPR